MALTILKVKNAKPGRHCDGRGLCLVVKDSGARTWVLRMQQSGKRRDYGLGSATEVSLADARNAEVNALAVYNAARTNLASARGRVEAFRW